jgi:serine protease Do
VKKILSSIIIAELLFWSNSFAVEPFFSISEQVKTVIPSIVKIKAQRSESNNDENELISTDSGGSGFMLDADHHIVTNAHVIGDAKKIVIIDNQNKEYPAEIIAKDDKSDIAILESSAFNAPILSEGNNTPPFPHTPSPKKYIFS